MTLSVCRTTNFDSYTASIDLEPPKETQYDCEECPLPVSYFILARFISYVPLTEVHTFPGLLDTTLPVRTIRRTPSRTMLKRFLARRERTIQAAQDFRSKAKSDLRQHFRQVTLLFNKARVMKVRCHRSAAWPGTTVSTWARTICFRGVRNSACSSNFRRSGRVVMY